jgi:hypothetical protein
MVQFTAVLISLYISHILPCAVLWLDPHSMEGSRILPLDE